MADQTVVGITADLDATQAVAARDAQIAQLSQRVTDLTAQLGERGAEIVGASRRVADLEAEIAALKAAQAGPALPPPPAGTPQEIRLTAPYGYVDETGRTRNWRPGEVITDPHEIALLVGRGATHEVTKPASA